MFLAYLSLFLLPVYLYGVVCFWRYSDADIPGPFLLGRLACLSGALACLVGLMVSGISLMPPWRAWFDAAIVALFALSVVLLIIATRVIIGEMAHRRCREGFRSASE